MTTIREAVRRLFEPPQPLPAGMYTYQAPPDSPYPYRMHLRLEADGSGILILNASTVLHLNKTAAEYAYHLVNLTSEDEIARTIAMRYKVNRAKAQQDYRDFQAKIQELIDTPDLDPITVFGFDRAAPYSAGVSAPYRLDCALTYRLPPGAPPEAVPSDRVTRELETSEWKLVMDKAWQAGIPHLVFTGGEPSLREDLFDLIEYAESKGQVTGLITGGLKLSDQAYLDRLLLTGLDHLMLVFNPEIDQSWEALRRALAADLFTAVHLTIKTSNLTGIHDLLDRLVAEGVGVISLSAAPEARSALSEIRDAAAEKGLSLVWDLPVPYFQDNPVTQEVEAEETPEGAGHAWLYIEPDGDVLPAQGVNKVLGNFLINEWEEIWKPGNP